MATHEIIGHWILIFLTISILSYLYADNPFYKLAEHLFVGTSIGYVVVVQWFDVIKPNLYDRLTNDALGPARIVYLIPLCLVLFLFAKLVPRFAWLSRISVAFVIGFYAGQNIPAYLNSDLVAQVASTLAAVTRATKPDATWHQMLGAFVLVVGMLSGLVYFFFSRRESGPLNAVARVGVWVLMIGFGASFGYTVQGRISLAIGRALEVFGMNRTAAQAEQLHGKLVAAVCVVVIFGIVAFLEHKRKLREAEAERLAAEQEKRENESRG